MIGEFFILEGLVQNRILWNKILTLNQNVNIVLLLFQQQVQQKIPCRQQSTFPLHNCCAYQYIQLDILSSCLRHTILLNQQVMSGLKNLIPKAALSEDNFVILKRKSQEYRKNIGILITHLEQISKIYADYYSIFQQNLAVLSSQFQGVDEYMPKFFNEILVIYKCVNKQLRKFIEKTAPIQQALLSLNDLFSIDYNLLVQTFEQQAREYIMSEQISMEISRRYFKFCKQMSINVQDYKDSFINVKLIYNKDERVKRYNDCTATYKSAEEDLANITSRLEELNYFKNKLISSYHILEQQLVSFIITSVFKYIDQLKKFYQLLSEFQQNKMQSAMDKTQGLDKQVINNLFTSPINFKYKQLITCQINPVACEDMPCFLLYHSYLNEEGRAAFPKMVVSYSTQISLRVEKRKLINKKMYEYMVKYIKGLDKYLIDSFKQTLGSFQKMRKKIGDVFGNRWKIFYKMITSIFENNIQNTSRLIKKIQSKLKSIDNGMNQSSAHMDNFLKQMKQYVQKLSVSKKKSRKYSGKLENIQFHNIKQNKEQKGAFPQELKEQCELMVNLIEKYSQNLENSDDIIKNAFIGILNDIKNAMAEFQSYCSEMDKTCYHDQYQKNYKLCQQDINDSLKKEMKFFQEVMPFAIVLKDHQKISFQSDFYKIQAFKKIKKPKELEEIINSKKSQMSVNQQICNQSNTDCNVTVPETLSEMTGTDQITDKSFSTLSKDFLFPGTKMSKKLQLLAKKFQFKQNQKYVKSFSCGMVDKIVLTGKMYITTERVCFHSKFNAKNLFGQTFIQIPKSDIKKVQKRSSLFFNSSIAITTINGQMIFTSFFSRDVAYDTLMKTIEICSEAIYFEEEQQEQEQVVEEQINFEDDMKEEIQKIRESVVLTKIHSYDYVLVNESQITFPGLTIIKFLRLFELDQEIKVNRMTYPSFSYYYKDLEQHKQISLSPWSPNPVDFINTVALKESIPEVFTRKVSAIVPMPSSNIPFMPKASLTVEDHSLFIVNKNKFVLQMVVKSHGIPYCDSFDLRLKRTAESNQENKIQMKTEVFVYFNQSCMVKSTIEAKTYEQSKINMEKHATEIKSYLRMLEKKLKNNKNQGPGDKENDQSELIQQLESEINQLRGQNKKIQSDYVTLSADNSKKQKIIIALAVIILIELLLILT